MPDASAPLEAPPRVTVAGWTLPTLVVLALASPAALGASRPPSPEVACAFRVAGYATVWEAAGESALALARRAANDRKDAAARLRAARRLLRTEIRRVARGGPRALGTHEARRVRRLLAGLVRGMGPALRALRTGATSPVAAGPATSIRGYLETLLGTECAPPGRVEVRRVYIPAGESRLVPAGMEIVGREGVEIAGELATAGGVTLRAQAGDLVVRGRIVPADEARSSSGQPSTRASRSSPRAAPQPPGDYLLTASSGAVSLQRDPSGALPVVRARRGEDAIDVVLAGPRTDGTFKGDAGARGGDIRIEAASLVLPPDLRADEWLLWPGHGGRGANVTVALPGFHTTATSVRIEGGDGGRGGTLELAVSVVGNPPTPVPGAALGDSPEVVWAGYGGNGGGVSMLFPAPPAPGSAWDPPFAATSFTLAGGRGGDALSSPGDGGSADLVGGGWLIGPPEAAPAMVSALGGSGGDVLSLPPPFMQRRANGGHGGAAAGLGFRGADGTKERPDGVEGGRLEVRGGSGGTVPAGARVLRASGGDGGDVRDTSVAGIGGAGYAQCNGCAGGRGGDGGDAVVRGGTGGDALAGTERTGGTGGSVLRLARPGSGGAGGNGNPAGRGGDPGTYEIGGGAAGAPIGTAGGVAEAPSALSGADGLTCGETLACNAAGCCPDVDAICGQLNTAAQVLTIRTIYPDGQTATETITRFACSRRDDLGNCIATGTHRLVSPDGSVSERPSAQELNVGWRCHPTTLEAIPPGGEYHASSARIETCANCGDWGGPACYLARCPSARCERRHGAPTLFCSGGCTGLPSCPLPPS